MPVRSYVPALILLAAPVLACGQTPLKLREPFPAGYQYHVSTRLTLSGELRLPAEVGKSKPETVAMSGTSAVEYDERVLVGGDGDKPSPRTFRQYRRFELSRKVGDQPQEAELRSNVRRMVVFRTGHREVPFSPDAPLTWGELELVRTDVFAPALAALLPPRPVAPGDRWQAGASAIEELTDLEKVDSGSVECTFDEVTTLAGVQRARIRLAGTVRGVSEDGPTRHKLDGYFFFDLATSHISYLFLDGVQTLLDKDGKESGQVRGQFVMTRQAHVRVRELGDDAMRALTLEPNDANTMLFYDNPDLGVRFLHPRRWRVGLITGRQIAIDDSANGGNGILLTVELPAKVPTVDSYRTESEAFIAKQKGRLLKSDPPRLLSNPPIELEQFGYEAEIGGQRVKLEYFIVRQPSGGATLAARLTANDLAATVRDVERIARSVRVDPRPAGK